VFLESRLTPDGPITNPAINKSPGSGVGDKPRAKRLQSQREESDRLG
jgi:hypothetical protein